MKKSGHTHTEQNATVMIRRLASRLRSYISKIMSEVTPESNLVNIHSFQLSYPSNSYKFSRLVLYSESGVKLSVWLLINYTHCDSPPLSPYCYFIVIFCTKISIKTSVYPTRDIINSDPTLHNLSIMEDSKDIAKIVNI